MFSLREIFSRTIFWRVRQVIAHAIRLLCEQKSFLRKNKFLRFIFVTCVYHEQIFKFVVKKFNAFLHSHRINIVANDEHRRDVRVEFSKRVKKWTKIIEIKIHVVVKQKFIHRSRDKNEHSIVFLRKIQNLNKIVWTLMNFYCVVVNAFSKRKRSVVLIFFNTISIFWSATSNRMRILMCFFSMWI